ncbi:hypothetical protein SAMN05444159_1286 [Bradyrhizobium lablabi]|uniref:Uncharacterized protein n=1 Tax=Bradyrhizobium lablabi TaxID=722472 RepID=A0A1M6LII1_9BRAD|nr:hypothetical protein [Bradyrhizobium lablabi]SHJ70991.1 hypothetical protein SAMN05444159_1286 [Bradyrhizobium lablabi]
MTLVNRMIMEAKAGATELKIRPADVNKVALHIRGCANPQQDIETIKKYLLGGEVKMLDVPIRVIGQKRVAA